MRKPYVEVSILPAGPFTLQSAPHTLVATPQGGTWSGSGMVGNVFHPQIAGVGIHRITYTIEPTAEHCGGSAHIDIEVTDTEICELQLSINNAETCVGGQVELNVEMGSLPELCCVSQMYLTIQYNPQMLEFLGASSQTHIQIVHSKPNGEIRVLYTPPSGTSLRGGALLAMMFKTLQSGWSDVTIHQVDAMGVGVPQGYAVTGTVHANEIEIAIQASSQEICAGETVSLTASGADTYVWSTGDTQASITVRPTQTTSYSVTGTKDGLSNGFNYFTRETRFANSNQNS